MKKLFAGVPLVIGSVLIAYPLLSDRVSDKIAFLPELSLKLSRSSKDATVWRVGSIYDGDTLRLIGDNRELKIRLCGIDAPEKQMPLGIEARDYLRSLIAKSNGTVHLIEVETDRYGRTVAELFVPLKSNPEREIHLNSAMIEAGLAWHYEQYSGNCPNQYGLEIAENIAKDNKVGVYSGEHQKPWDWRKSQK